MIGTNEGACRRNFFLQKLSVVNEQGVAPEYSIMLQGFMFFLFFFRDGWNYGTPKKQESF